jgi:hypothetical protein
MAPYDTQKVQKYLAVLRDAGASTKDLTFAQEFLADSSDVDAAWRFIAEGFRRQGLKV